DSLYLIADAKGTYTAGSWYNPFWYFAPVLFAWAAWLPGGGSLPHRTEAADAGARGIVIPLGFACVALGTLVWTSPTTDDAPAVALAASSLLVVFARLALTWLENARLLKQSRTEALTDELTGLPNRRALV